MNPPSIGQPFTSAVQPDHAENLSAMDADGPGSIPRCNYLRPISNFGVKNTVPFREKTACRVLCSFLQDFPLLAGPGIAATDNEEATE